MPKYSVVVPVYDRPEELSELLESLEKQVDKDLEVIIVEDGSKISSEPIVNEFRNNLDLKYYQKDNSGPALSRNFGADRSYGEWLIFLDSDCFVPSNYTQVISEFLSKNDIDMFGGPDRDHVSFSSLQRGINYAMTSVITTGGIRGKRGSVEKFKPRSFNMGIRKELFQKLEGFSDLRFGEDIDLSLRAEKLKFNTALIEDSFVYHKRRSTFWQFYKQVYNSGVARIVLNTIHKNSLKLVHTLPSFFLLGHLLLLIFLLYEWQLFIFLIPLPLIIFIHALILTRKIKVATLAVTASYIQFIAYGLGFIKGWLSNLFGKKVKHKFVEKFYDP